MGECQVSLDTSSDSITPRSSANNSKSIHIVSWWDVMHFWLSFVFLLPLYSSGPCYLHSSSTSSDVFTLEMCNTTPWFTDGDNLCFRQAEAATARGVGFPSAIYRAGDFSCGQHSYRAPALCPQTDLLAAKQPALVHALASSTRPSLSLSLGFVPVFLTLYLIHSVYPRFHLKPPFPLTSFPSLSLPLA